MNYDVYLSTKITPKKIKAGTCPLVIQPDDYTTTQVKALAATGRTVLAYISIGTLQKERPWYKKYKNYRLKKLEDWPNEYYIDVRKNEWQNFLINRAKVLKSKGFKGLWCDNLDVYEYYKSDSMFTACKDILTKLKKINGYIMVNGGSEFFDKAMDKGINLSTMVNGVTQEEVFSLIKNYSGKGVFGEQKKDQKNFYKSYMKRLLKCGVQTFLLEYTRDTKVEEKIKDFCKQNKMTGYYISKGVNL